MGSSSLSTTELAVRADVREAAIVFFVLGLAAGVILGAALVRA